MGAKSYGRHFLKTSPLIAYIITYSDFGDNVEKNIFKDFKSGLAKGAVFL